MSPNMKKYCCKRDKESKIRMAYYSRKLPAKICALKLDSRQGAGWTKIFFRDKKAAAV